MTTENLIYIIIAVAIFVAIVISRSKKSRKTSGQTPPTRHPAPSPAPAPPAPPPAPNPTPNPGKPPEDPNDPPPPPESPAVLIDRNGKRPGDEGYDPRRDAPPGGDRFSPPEPFGAFYGEGPFDPDARWIGPDGVHWTDRNGVHHGPHGG